MPKGEIRGKGKGKGKAKKKLPFTLRLRCTNDKIGNDNSEKSNTKSKTCKSTNWRHKMKQENPTKYAELLQRTKDYNRLQRLEMSLAESTLKKRNITKEERENAEKYLEKKKRYNKITAKRMAKLRTKKREKAKEDKAKGRRLTRSEEIKRKEKLEKDAKRQRDRRAAMPKSKQAEILANRRAKYHAEKSTQHRQREQRRIKEMDDIEARQAELKKQEEIVSNMMRRLEEEKKTLQEQTDKLKDNRRPEARRKSLQRARSILPVHPAHYVSTCIDLITKASPTKKKIFEDHGIGAAHIETKLVSTIAEEMKGSLKSRKKLAVKKRQHFAGIARIMKKYSLQGKAAKLFNIGRHALNKSSAHRQKQHGNSIKASVVKSVTIFYEENAIYLPDKKCISKKTLKKTGFLQSPVSDLFTKFKKSHPNVKIGLKKFHALRPKHIKLQSALKFRGCLCEYCTNLELKATSLNKLAHSYGLRSVYQGVHSVSRSTLCPKLPGAIYYQRRCIERDCSKCGTKGIKDHLKRLQQCHGNKPLTWKQWERVTVQEGGKQVTKQVLQEKHGKFEDIIDHLMEESKQISSHLHNASWQNHQFSKLTKEISSDSVVMVLDFAENFTCTYQDEIQSAHWYHTTATIHPIVCYHKCNDCEDAITQESLVFISNDKSHDYHAVHEFMSQSVIHISKKMHIDTIYRFSDQCASQYKSKGPFMDLATAELEYGIMVEHHYFGARHGKGPSDGETAVVKRQATSAVAAGRAVINNAHDLYSFCKDTMTIDNSKKCQHFQRHLFFVDTVDIDRDRGHDETDLTTIKGTRKLHCAKGTFHGNLWTRNLSCFCEGCKLMEPCRNNEYVDLWDSKTLFTIPPPVTQLSFREEPILPRETQAPDPKTPATKTTGLIETQAPGPETPVKKITSLNETQAPSLETSAKKTTGLKETQAPNPETPATSIKPDKHNTDEPNLQTTLDVQDFVAVRVPRSGKKAKSDELHVAKIASILDDGSYSLSYMTKASTSNLFSWPQGDEVFFLHPLTDIISKLDPPEPVLIGSRLAFRFSFKDAEEMFCLK